MNGEQVDEAARAQPDSAEAIKVFILDDHELVRRGLQDLLEGEGFEVIGQSGSAREATGLIPVLRPDVSILDARLPDGTGIEVCRDVLSVDPSLRCVILTSYDDERSLRSAVIAGRQDLRAKRQLRTVWLVIGSGIMLLVTLGSRGVNLLPAHFIEHNEKRISGIVLILVGIISFFLH